MRLGIMQPYFLPYLGYFSLIAATDQFVVFDPVQYIRHGWINRNRILKPGLCEPQYIQVPLTKHSRQTLIRDVLISPATDWKTKILRQLDHYQSRSPFFEQTREIVIQCLAIETDSIVKLNVHCLKTICAALNLPFQARWFDEIEADIEPVAQPGDWALHIATALKATSYINPVGGREILKTPRFRERGMELLFLDNELACYPQRNDQFVPGLSIVDVLMFNSLESTRQQIDQYTLSP